MDATFRPAPLPLNRLNKTNHNRPVRALDEAKAQQRQGHTIFVYTNYPNGNPVDSLERKQVIDILKVALPGTVIDPNMYVFGRVKIKNKDTGVVVYPISMADARNLQSVVQANTYDPYKIEEEVNKNVIPKIIEKDLKKGDEKPLIYDLSKNRTLTEQEVQDLSGVSRDTTPAPPPTEKPAPDASRGEAHQPTAPKKLQSAPRPAGSQEAGNVPKKKTPAPQPSRNPAPAIPYQYKVSTQPSVNPQANRGHQQQPVVFKPLMPGQHAPPFPGMW